MPPVVRCQLAEHVKIVYTLSTLAEGNLARLIDEVASNAILNAGGRADEV